MSEQDGLALAEDGTLYVSDPEFGVIWKITIDRAPEDEDGQ